MLQLRCRIDGAERTYPLVGERIRIGRGPANEVRLLDPSVSRHHAVIERREETVPGAEADVAPRVSTWIVRDLGSTNGTRVNGERIDGGPLAAGDDLRIGAFDLQVEEVTEGGSLLGPRPPADWTERTKPAPPPPETAPTGTPTGASAPPPLPAPRTPGPRHPVDVSHLPNASIVRPLADFTSDYGLSGEHEAPARATERAAADESEVAYGNRVFGYLTRLAQLLITAEAVPDVLERVVEIAFEALPVERGFILIQDRDGRPVCELARFGDRVEHRPEEGVPVSQTILDAVMNERLALLTFDAQVDDRLAVGDSIRIHGIRAAMSAPLWSGQGIIGVIQVDSPVQAGAFGERDLDFLTALANYAAVAVERLRHAHQIEVERRLRSRFERYHSPSVIEEMLRQSEAAELEADSGVRKLQVTDATVLFADLVGFTALAEQLDPGAVAELLEGYFNHAVEAIFAAGGTLDKFIGDAVMAFFGAPYEQPDHARRAVEAAIGIHRKVAEWNETRRQEGQPALELRIGINSGPVVVGDVGAARRVDYTVLGNTVNVAARLEQFVAAPGEIVVGPETHGRLGGTVETEDLGDLTLKGLREKVRGYRVVF